MTIHDILRRVEIEHISFIHLQFVDIQGTLKEVVIPQRQLQDALTQGIWFDGSSIEGFVRIFESDMILKPDIETFAVLPWTDGNTKSARIICDVYQKEEPFAGDPRSILRNVTAQAQRLGYTSYMGPEVEFFLLKKNNGGTPHPLPHDEAGYFDAAPQDLASEIRKKITNALHAMHIPVEAAHHEVAIGQHEIDLQYQDALRMADYIVTLKYVIRSIAHQYDLEATFMPKPFFGINGSGMHTHQSLFQGEQNVFYESGAQYNLSATARSYIAGLIDHAAALTAVVSPTINSHKRLVPGYEAPVYVCWAQTNRAAWIRVPHISPGREKSTRVELRSPDPSSNPYLAFAAMLAAGLDGIKRKLTPPAPVEENVYLIKEGDLEKYHIRKLPGSTQEAADSLAKDHVISHALGAHTVEKMKEIVEQEWNEYQNKYALHPSSWEISRYLTR